MSKTGAISRKWSSLSVRSRCSFCALLFKHCTLVCLRCQIRFTSTKCIYQNASKIRAKTFENTEWKCWKLHSSDPGLDFVRSDRRSLCTTYCWFRRWHWQLRGPKEKVHLNLKSSESEQSIQQESHHGARQTVNSQASLCFVLCRIL